MRPLILKMLVGIIFTFILLICLCSLLGFLHDVHWFLALFEHFRRQYFWIQVFGLVCVICWLIVSKRKLPSFYLCLLLLLVTLLNLSAILGSSQLKASISVHTQRSFTLLHTNVFAANQDSQRLLSLIEHTHPDLIDIVEYTPEWQQRLEKSGILTQYPYRKVGSHAGIYSKFPLTKSELFYTPPKQAIANAANLLVTFQFEKTPVSLLLVHPPVPVLHRYATLQKNAFSMWIRDRKNYGENLILVGDFNTTRWSANMQRLLNETDLTNINSGIQANATWPITSPTFAHKTKIVIPLIPILGIPIDHVLTSPRIIVLKQKIGPDIGSDHAPLITTFAIATGK